MTTRFIGGGEPRLLQLALPHAGASSCGRMAGSLVKLSVQWRVCNGECEQHQVERVFLCVHLDSCVSCGTWETYIALLMCSCTGTLDNLMVSALQRHAGTPGPWRLNLNASERSCARAGLLPRDFSPRILPEFSRWHLTSQDVLFSHLHSLWGNEEARTMLDLGCHAGAGPYLNLSDALLWMKWFNHSGGTVVGVDAFEDYALDLQQRFDHVSPYSGVPLRKVALHAAMSSRDNELVDATHLSRVAITCCASAGWCRVLGRLDRKNYPNHYCRITRQRVAAACPADECHNTTSSSTLPLPPSSYPRQREEAPVPGRRRARGHALAAHFRLGAPLVCQG